MGEKKERRRVSPPRLYEAVLETVERHGLSESEATINALLEALKDEIVKDAMRGR